MAKMFNRFLNMVLLCFSLVVLGFWIFNQPLLKIFSANHIMMVFNSAFCFALCAIGLSLPRHYARAKTVLGLVVFTLSSLVLAQDISGISSGIDQWLVTVHVFDYNPHPGRISPPSAVCFMLSGLGLFYLGRPRNVVDNVCLQVMTLTVICISIVGFAGASIRFELLYEWYKYGRMAAASAIGFIIFSISLWMQWYEQETIDGSYLARQDRKISVTGIVIIFTVALSAGMSGFGVLANQMERTLEAGLQEAYSNHAQLVNDDIEASINGALPITSRILLNRMLTAGRAKETYNAAARAIIQEDAESFINHNFTFVAIYAPSGALIAQAGKPTVKPQLTIPLNPPSSIKKVELLWSHEAILRLVMDIAPDGATIGTAIVERKLPVVTKRALTKDALGATSETRICHALSEQEMECLPSVIHPAIMERVGRIFHDNVSSMDFALRGLHGIRVARDYRDHQVVTAYGPIDSYGLGMVVKIDSAEFYGPIRAKLEYALAILFALSLGGVMVQRMQLIPLVRRLVESEERISTINRFQQTLLDSANFTIISCDTRGIIQVFNKSAERMLGYTADEVIGKQTPAIFHDPELVKKRAEELSRELGREIKPGFEAFIARAALMGSDEREWIYIRKDGSRYPVLLSISCLRNSAGEITGSLGIGVDITESKRLDTLKSEFISTVSHELRTPLTSIRGSLGLILAGVGGALPDKLKHLIDIAHKNCERLILLINDILDMEKIESGQMHFESEWVSLKPLLEQSVELNRPYGEKLQVTFVNQPDFSTAHVQVDPARFVQVMANLLSNAAKFSKTGGEVFISTREHHNTVDISVTDYGQGIPEEFQSRIFGKFSQADSSDGKAKGGTGLGLNISKSMVEQMGGTLSFISKTNVATTFTINLPLQEKATAPTISDTEVEKKILICEDDADIATILRLTFEREGYRVDVAHTASRAAELLTTTRYLAMTLDLGLPDKDGVRFIRDVRAQKHTRDLPIIVISAQAEEGRKTMNGSAIGILDWMVKPIDTARLMSTIQRLVSLDRAPVVLHVEDDADIAEVVALGLGSVATILHAATLQEARTLIQTKSIDLVLLDLTLPDGSGLQLLEMLSMPEDKPIPVILFSATEVSSDVSRKVAAALVKSRTSEDDIMATVLSLIAPKVNS